MVNLQPFAHGLFFIIIALNQRFAGNIIFAFFFGRIKNNVIGSAAGKMGPASAHPFDDFIIRHIDVDHGIDRHPGFFHGIGLGYGSWKTVK